MITYKASRLDKISLPLLKKLAKLTFGNEGEMYNNVEVAMSNHDWGTTREAAGDEYIVVAYEKNHAIGWSLCLSIYEYDEKPKTAAIGVYVHEKYRRTGIGTKLVDKLKAILKKKRVKYVEVGAHDYQSEKFYKKQKAKDGHIKLQEFLREQSDSEYDAAEDFFTRRSEQLIELARLLKNSGGQGRLPWKTVPASLLTRVWLQFGKYNRINTNDLDKIADQILTNIARLRASTEMMGHTQWNPREELRDEEGIEFTDEEWDKWMSDYFTDVNGAWLLSDYGLPQLEKLYGPIFNAKDDEQKLYAIDKVLNVVHARSDLASMFVEGGTKTLHKISNQGGYHDET